MIIGRAHPTRPRRAVLALLLACAQLAFPVSALAMAPSGAGHSEAPVVAMAAMAGHEGHPAADHAHEGHGDAHQPSHAAHASHDPSGCHGEGPGSSGCFGSNACGAPAVQAIPAPIAAANATGRIVRPEQAASALSACLSLQLPPPKSH
jgi:hypothetical protein